MLLTRSIDIPLLLCVALLPLQWFTLYKFGGRSLEPFHFPVLLLILLTGIQQRYLANAFFIISRNISWMGPFFLYFTLFAISTGYSSEPESLGTLIRQLTFVIFGIFVGARLLDSKQVSASLYFGSIMALTLFCVLIHISADKVGLDAGAALIKFVTTGDYVTWSWGFFEPVFNAFTNESGRLSGNRDFAANNRNNVASALLTCYILFKIGSINFPRYPAKKVLDLLISTAFVSFILLILSRNVIISMLIAILISFGIRISLRPLLYLVPIMFYVTGIAIALIAVSDLDIGNTFYDRFFVKTGSYEERLVINLGAMRIIEQNIWFGDGYSIRIDGAQIHNLFLAAWAQAGVFAFVAAVLFWLIFVLKWGQRIVRCWRDRTYWRLNVPGEWVMALPVMPMFYVWLGGDSGNMNLPGWLSVGVFVGLILRNDLQRTFQSNATATGRSSERRHNLAVDKGASD